MRAVTKWSIAVVTILAVLQISISYAVKKSPVKSVSVSSKTLTPGQTTRKTKDGAVMVYVPAGEFTAAGNNETTPKFKMKLAAYWIDKYEVTNAQFSAFVRKTGYTPEGYWREDRVAGKGALPAIDVTWRDANAYARWAGKRLPTEMEWERAARGTDARIYPWGNEWDASRAVVERDSRTKVEAVGTHPGDISPVGCYDMAGNADEWCLEHYSGDAYLRYAKGDMRVQTLGYVYSIRTCGAVSNSKSARCDTRSWATPGMRWCGFRCVIGPEPKLVPLDVDYGYEMNPEPFIYRTPNPPKKPKPGDVWICPKNKAEMVYIPAGEYKSGHNFKLTMASTGAFWITRYPITVTQFRNFVKSTRFKPVIHWECYDVPGHELHPAQGIAYEDAEAYAKWMGQRLPKPNEWEKSARGTDGRSFPWGNKWNDDYCIPYYIPDFETVPIGTRPINCSPYGVWDMASENPEWVDDPNIDKQNIDGNSIFEVGAPSADPSDNTGRKLDVVISEDNSVKTVDNPGAQRKKNNRSYKRQMYGFFAPLGDPKPFQTAPSKPVFKQACKQPDGKTYEQPDNSPMNYTFRCVLDAE